jgi:hypothetical protein
VILLEEMTLSAVIDTYWNKVRHSEKDDRNGTNGGKMIADMWANVGTGPPVNDGNVTSSSRRPVSGYCIPDMRLS